MRIEEAVMFAEHAQTMTDIPGVKEFYAMAEKALRTQNQANWISVKDDKPKEGQTFVCAGIKGGYFFVNKMKAGELRESGRRISVWHGWAGWRQFTHWMPVPEVSEREE